MSKVVINTEGPVVGVLAEMNLLDEGLTAMADWVKSRRPECGVREDEWDLFPHNVLDGEERQQYGGVGTHTPISSNELLVELAGRKCYDSFGAKAGRKTNKEYIAHTQSGDIPHASIMYHAKMSFFIGGISMRVARDLIRHYVGADRTEEGSPSAESTRFTHHYGWYVAHPRDLDDAKEVEEFRVLCRENYDAYQDYIRNAVQKYEDTHGLAPKGLDRKRIYEAAATRLNMAAETSLVWTTNPAALAKLIREREHEASDLEFQRLARILRQKAVTHWPNLFPNLPRDEEGEPISE